MKPHVLLVDDEASVRFAMSEVLREQGYQVTVADSGQAALPLFDAADVVITDYAMPGMTGLELLAQLRSRDTQVPVILITAHGSEKIAVQAMKEGAYDYVTKPFDIDEFALVIARATEARNLRRQTQQLSAERALGRHLVATSLPMRRFIDAATRVAARDVTVLVRGETGTGKELMAQLIHAQSHRSLKPLIRFNCAAIPGELAESELFGHSRGAFTGAHGTREGFFAAANGGTLILDEIGELPLAIQAKLLRTLQNGEIQPVGSGRVDVVDVRVIAVTNRDLLAEVAAGRFREDLYYRLAVVELQVPSLRDRAEDIPDLAREFGRAYGEKFGLGPLAIAPDVLERMRAFSWPGNVRQLENAVAKLAALASSTDISLSDYEQFGPGHDRHPTPPHGAPAVPDGGDPGDEESDRGAARDAFEDKPDKTALLTLREQVEAFERGIIARALEACRHNQSEAARRLGTSRVTLIDKIKKYGLARR